MLIWWMDLKYYYQTALIIKKIHLFIGMMDGEKMKFRLLNMVIFGMLIILCFSILGDKLPFLTLCFNNINTTHYYDVLYAYISLFIPI